MEPAASSQAPKAVRLSLTGPPKSVRMSLSIDERSDAARVGKKKTIKKIKKSKQTKQMTIAEKYHFMELISEEQAQCLSQTAKCLVRPGMGILAADDTMHRINTKLEEFNLYPSNLNRHKFHEVYLGSNLPLEDFLSGVLMREESITHDVLRGKKLMHMIRDRHLKLGIRLDRGVVPLAGTNGEFTTWGLDTIEKDCQKVKELGAEFALWRCVYKVSDTNPSKMAMQENSRTLARFAAVCQKAGLLPIVAVDVLPQGTHNDAQATAIMREILTELVKALAAQHVFLEGTLVRVTAAAPGTCYKGVHNLTRVAAGTAETLNQCLPPALGGVVMAREENLARSLEILNNIQNCPVKKPFFVSFCFSRVILDGVVSLWAGQDQNLDKARQELIRRLECCSLATFGQCSGKHRTMFIKEECAY
ncbi:fructose-bisphosphate aldolase [Elysia marginata]|uniref:fructose-bisphosphate aldolase n=1 Tax=Elysia marginata TaxID=1093978 RepID=A0AAV4FAS8_9GAST|nr:fructose-bisphosphate aldolase [Elysia marginata]